MSLFKRIIQLKGNDARRERALKRIIRGEALEINDMELCGASIPLWQKIFLYPFVFAAYNSSMFIYLMYLCIRRLKIGKLTPLDQLLPRATLEKLYAYWEGYPLVASLKIREAVNYCRERIDEPSLEIGVHTGYHSMAVNASRKVSVALEYLPDLALRLPLADKNGIFRNFVSGDATRLPFQDETFASIMSIHSIDDMNRPAQDVLREGSRILKPGGRLIVSFLGRDYRYANRPLEFLLRFLPRRRAEALRNIWMFGFYNIHTAEEWRKIARAYGFVIEKEESFISGIDMLFFAIPFRLEGLLWNMLEFRRIAWIPATLRRIIVKWSCEVFYRNDAVQNQEEDSAGTMNYYYVLKKNPTSHQRRDLAPYDHASFEIDKVLLCLKCGSPNFKRIRMADKSVLECCQCQNQYPVVQGVIIAHPPGVLN